MIAAFGFILPSEPLITPILYAIARLSAYHDAGATSVKLDISPFTEAPKARTIIAAICALVKLLLGIILPSEPVNNPFATAFSSAAVDQSFGMSVNLEVAESGTVTLAANAATGDREMINAKDNKTDRICFFTLIMLISHIFKNLCQN